MRDQFFWWFNNYDDGSLEMFDYYEACFKEHLKMFRCVDNTSLRRLNFNEMLNQASKELTAAVQKWDAASGIDEIYTLLTDCMATLEDATDPIFEYKFGIDE